MKGDPNKRNKSKYCRFHRDHGHDTDECYDLKQQIENLIKQEKLRHFVGRDHRDEKLKGKMEESSRPPLGEIRSSLKETQWANLPNRRKRISKWYKMSSSLDDLQGRVQWTSLPFPSLTKMLRGSITPMTMQLSLLCLLQIIQPREYLLTMEAQQTYCTILPSNR